VPPLKREEDMPPPDSARAFAAVALAAVSWDGVLTAAGSRAVRHALDYRQPFCSLGIQATGELVDGLLADLRRTSAQQLMLEAAQSLTVRQRRIAFAVATEIMRSDGPLEADERNILASLADSLDLADEEAAKIFDVMDLLHGDITESS
jgi:hypothetical protein